MFKKNWTSDKYMESFSKEIKKNKNAKKIKIKRFITFICFPFF